MYKDVVIVNAVRTPFGRGMGGYPLGAICGGLAQADACIIKV